MGCMAQTAPSHQGRTSHTCSKQRTKSAAFSTSHHLHSTRLPVVLVASKSSAVLEFQFLSPLLQESTLFLLGTGTREIIMYAEFIFSWCWLVLSIYCFIFKILDFNTNVIHISDSWSNWKQSWMAVTVSHHQMGFSSTVRDGMDTHSPLIKVIVVK